MSTYSSSFINTSTVKVKDSEGFPGGLEVKASACNSGDLGLIPGLGRYHGEGNGNPFQYSCLESPMDGGVWWTAVHGVTRIRHDLATTPPPPLLLFFLFNGISVFSIFCVLFRNIFTEMYNHHEVKLHHTLVELGECNHILCQKRGKNSFAYI